jgi:hypothetical protein
LRAAREGIRATSLFPHEEFSPADNIARSPALKALFVNVNVNVNVNAPRGSRDTLARRPYIDDADDDIMQTALSWEIPAGFTCVLPFLMERTIVRMACNGHRQPLPRPAACRTSWPKAVSILPGSGEPFAVRRLSSSAA